jgi:hypothetical protein
MAAKACHLLQSHHFIHWSGAFQGHTNALGWLLHSLEG